MGYSFGFKRNFAVSALCGSLFWCIYASAEPLAFPEALGFGANVTGGRAGTVYHVTNLNDDGAGSFRDAVSQGNRIVVFDVGGIINIKTAVSIKSNITIAGQTAPGEGIAIHGGKLSTGKQNNIIIRYLRIRPGENTASTKDDALNLYDAKNVIVDHCSVELAPWNNFGGSSDNADHRVTGITVQNSLIANPIGQQFGAHIESIDGTWAWYYNAFVNTHNRNPLDKINDIFVNNILYNFEAGFTTHTSAKFKHDIINNYFVYGPEGKNEWFQVDKNQSIYANGNLIDKNRDGVLNGGPTSIYYYQGPGEELKNPWNELTTKGPMMSAASAWRYVTSQSGVLPYDDIDSLIWHQVGTLGKEGALVKSVGAMGFKTNNGWGEVIAGKAATDGDKDGMPDYFENAMGYDVAKDDAMVKESDGYVRIEKYINWLGAMHAQVAGNGTLDFDLRTITRGFQEVKPSYTVSAAENGSVELQKDGYTARFTPDKNYKGLASFKYTVKGNDNTEYTGRIEILVEKSANASEPPEQPRDSSETAQDSSKTAQDSTTAIKNARAIRNVPQMRKNTFHDLKGRRFEKQIPYRVLF
ncbi:Pectate lyase [Fibrobacter sp. UWB11]|nr:Pectate lyase [Fibrobacter sp. UWB11]